MESPSVQTEPSAMSDVSAKWHHPTVLLAKNTKNNNNNNNNLLERAASILPTSTTQSILKYQLPTDVETVHLEAKEHTPTQTDPINVHLDVVVARKVPLIGYVILFSGLIVLASVGAALDLQKGGVSPVMKTLWRQMATCAVLLPLVLLRRRR